MTPRLLLVEDDADNLELLTTILSQTYRVFSYADASEALAALETAKPELLLLDIGIGPFDGLECLAAMRARPGYGSVPAIALTGYGREAERKAFQAAGFQAVFIKPVLDYQDFFGTITALLAATRGGSERDEGSDHSATTTAA